MYIYTTYTVRILQARVCGCSPPRPVLHPAMAAAVYHGSGDGTRAFPHHRSCRELQSEDLTVWAGWCVLDRCGLYFDPPCEGLPQDLARLGERAFPIVVTTVYADALPCKLPTLCMHAVSYGEGCGYALCLSHMQRFAVGLVEFIPSAGGFAGAKPCYAFKSTGFVNRSHLPARYDDL
jgi:hypothetical protein